METNYKLKLFIRFLKRNHIYNQFFVNARSDKACHLRKFNRRKENIINFINNELNNGNGYNIITGAFHWDETEEGFYFWHRINCKWDILWRICLLIKQKEWKEI